MNDVKIQSRNLGKDVKGINRKIQTQKRSFLNLGSFQETSERIGTAKNQRIYEKERKKADKSFIIPRKIKNQYGNLRRELRDVLNDMYYNVFSLTGLAFEMGIDFPDNTSKKDLTLLIINKTILYVDLILGKSKGNYANAFFSSEPFNNILQYTSFSYITGKAGIDYNELRTKRKNAAAAKNLALKSKRNG
jgi:hypothetical protein